MSEYHVTNCPYLVLREIPLPLNHLVGVVLPLQTGPGLAVALQPLGVQGQSAADQAVETVFAGLADVLLRIMISYVINASARSIHSLIAKLNYGGEFFQEKDLFRAVT